MIRLWALVLPLLFMSYRICEDTVADDIGPHTIMRIAQLLTPLECQHFYLRITGPDRDLAKLTRAPSPFSERKRKRRDIVTIEDCAKTLNNWAETEGNTVYWDRVFSTLYKVGRVDVALELAKNLNQDKTMQMKKSVNELTKTAHESKSSLIIFEDEKFEEGNNIRLVRDLNSIKEEDWDLIVERRKVPPYGRHLNEWCWPMVYGVIFGFLAAPLLASLTFLMIFVMKLIDNMENYMHIKIK
ncbi:transmembrane and death domain protein 1 [Anomaloglossus baeobatrachus]|uniref:transmembrane and death domain protein 1 n=1 Tax=Anomaloglossus baeobatrachus TaxID=238106 RepID=UPI003F50B584